MLHIMKPCLACVLSPALALTALAQTNLPEAYRISGTVVDQAGRPVPDALVEVYQTISRGLFGWAEFELKDSIKTASNGIFELAGARLPTLVVVRKPGFATTWSSYLAPTNKFPSERFVLSPPGALGGLVVDENDKPVADAEVFVSLAMEEVRSTRGYRRFNSLTGEPARRCFSARTDANGRFRIEGFPINAVAQLTAKVPGKVVQEPSLARPTFDSGMYRAGDENVKLVLEPAGVIEGRAVVGETGQPVAGAVLWLVEDAPVLLSTPPLRSARSGHDGAFQITDVPSGSYRILARFGTGPVGDWVADSVRVKIEPGQTNRDVKVVAIRGGILEVTVLDKTNRKPIPRVPVGATKQGFWDGAVSDSNGIVTLRLPPGEYQLAAAKQTWGQVTAAVTVEPGKTNRVKLELTPPLKLTGMVRYPDGAPAAGLEVILAGAGSRPVWSEVRTDVNGRFELEWNPWERKPAGAACWVLIRDVERNMVVTREFDENSPQLELTLEPGAIVTGRVECEGKPVTNLNATLVLSTGDARVPLSTVNARSNMPGRFEITAVPPGHSCAVSVSAPGFSEKYIEIGVPKSNHVELGTITLKPANLRLAGQVLDLDDQPVAGAVVHVVGGEQPRVSAWTDTAGRFSFESVSEGTVQLMVSGRGLGGSALATAGDTNVVVYVDESLGPLDLSAPPKKLTGTVTGPDGKPAAGAGVTVLPHRHGRWRKTDMNGNFRLNWNPRSWHPGSPLLVARDTARNLAVAEEIDEYTTNVTLQLRPGLTVSGRVEDAEGKPLPRATVLLNVMISMAACGLDDKPIETDSDGRFEICALPPELEYVIFVSAPDHGLAQKRIPSEEQQTNKLELGPIVLKGATLKLAGKVVDAQGQPVAGASVDLAGAGQPSASAVTDREGRFAFEKVCEGPVELFARAGRLHGIALTEGGDTNVVVELAEPGGPGLEGPTTKRLKGTVSRPDGTPAAGVEVAVHPVAGETHVATDATGAFSITWEPSSIRPDTPPHLVARDPILNQVASVALDDETTEATLTLNQGLTLAGRVQDIDGKPIAGADITIALTIGGTTSTLDTKPVKSDSDGRFEITALPPDLDLTVHATAKGYGTATQSISPSDEQANRVELEPLVLRPANLKVAGRVVDTEERPVPGATVNAHGPYQPRATATTDENGWFCITGVCEGLVVLSAWKRPLVGTAGTKAGDTNAIIVVRPVGMLIVPPSPDRAARPRRAKLVGKPLPDLATVNLESSAALRGQPVLVCLFEPEQRPSRRCLRLLAEQYESLKQKGVATLVVQATPTTPDAFAAWKQANPLPFPTGYVNEESEKTEWATSVGSLPWLILANAEGHVVAEGFSIDELDTALQALAR